MLSCTELCYYQRCVVLRCSATWAVQRHDQLCADLLCADTRPESRCTALCYYTALRCDVLRYCMHNVVLCWTVLRCYLCCAVLRCTATCTPTCVVACAVAYAATCAATNAATCAATCTTACTTTCAALLPELFAARLPTLYFAITCAVLCCNLRNVRLYLCALLPALHNAALCCIAQLPALRCTVLLY